jgi:D-galactarolactone isomerase
MPPVPNAAGKTPKLKAPAGAVDTHMHIYHHRYPTAATAVVKPSDASVSDYLAMRRRIGVDRTVVVQPSAYGLDNTCTLDAIAEIGPSARGIAVCNEQTSDAELERLHKGGIRGLRFFMLPGGAVGWDSLEKMSARVAPLGWHIVLQLDGRDYPQHEAMIDRLVSPVVLDHTGKFLEPVALDHPGFQALTRLLKNKKKYLKLAAPYETSKAGPPFYADVGKFAKALVPNIPDQVVWASNWPHPSSGYVGPDDADMLDLLLDWVPDETTRRKALVDNPVGLYGY